MIQFNWDAWGPIDGDDYWRTLQMLILVLLESQLRVFRRPLVPSLRRRKQVGCVLIDLMGSPRQTWIREEGVTTTTSRWEVKIVDSVFFFFFFFYF